MILHKIWKFFTKSVRRQLIWAVVVVHAVLMTMFIWDVTQRQEDLLLDQQVIHATALAQSVSTSSAGWLLSRDVIGLQEIMDAQTRYPELLYAMTIDQEGLILAHTDRKRRGQYIVDVPVKSVPTILHQSSELVDIVSPAFVEGEYVGSVRIGLGQRAAQQQLIKITTNGLIYALAAILIGVILASIMGTRLTRRLYSIQSVANSIQRGEKSIGRVPDLGTDEAAQLARQFNKMLDTIDDREEEIVSYNAALHKSEARFQRSLRGSSDGLWEWNIQTNEVYYSPRWKAMLGYEEDELGSSFSIWEQLTHPDDVKRASTIIQEYLEGKKDNYKIEFRMRHKSGRWVHILSRGILERDKEGKPLLLSGTHVDITDRVNAEDNLHQLAENINEVFWLGSPSWDEVYYISPAFERIWGQSPEDLYRNPGLWIEAVIAEDRELVMNDIPADINSIGECVDFKEYRIQRPDGEIIWIKAKAYPIKDEDGQIIRMAGVAEDITNRVRMEEILRRTQKMDALGKLTGGIAHDYNNMLGVILGYSELLADRLGEQPDLLKYVNQINHAGQRGAKLTSKLLAFTKQQSIEAVSLNINALLLEKQHMLEKILTARIKLTFDLGDDLWVTYLDAGDLEDAIVNLSINAMHAIDAQGTLNIKTCNMMLGGSDARRLQLEPGDYVQISFNDSGKGMDEVTRGKIFEPFFSTKGEKGTGLGLSQVYGFVERSGGAIEVDSEPGQGARMILYFPQYQEVISQDQLNEKNKATEIESQATILLVDDEPALLELNYEVLSQQGFKVFCAENAKKALEILENESIELLISDIIMPEMNGYQLASIVKEKYPSVKIQLASGFSEDGNDNIIDENLQKNILFKPYTAQALLQRTSELLGKN